MNNQNNRDSQSVLQNHSTLHINTLLDHLPGFAYRSSYVPNWTTLFISKGVKTTTGFSPDEFTTSHHQNYHQLIVPRDRAYVEAVISEAIAKQTPFTLEYRIKNKSDETVWVSERGIPVFDDSNELIGIEGFVTDISDEKKARKEQFVSERKYSQLFRQMMNAFVIYEPVLNDRNEVVDFRYEEMNPAFDHHSAIPSHECLGKTILQVQGDMGPQVLQKYTNIYQSGTPHHFEIFNSMQNRYFSVHAFKPSHNRLAVIFHDVSEAALLNKALKVSEEKYRSLFESIFSAFAYCEPIFNTSGAMVDFKFLECNPALMQHTSMTPQEVMGKHCRELRIRCFDEWMPLFADVCKTGNPKTEERHNSVLDRYFRLSIFSPLPNRFAVLLDDITDQKQIQQRIIDTMIETGEKERRKLAGDLHDEIGPLLSSMRMYTASLQRKATDVKLQELSDLLGRLIDDSIEKVREISHNLSPAILERYGLVSAITAECELMELIMPIEFNHNIRQIRFDSRIETTIYRIVKELINNTKKHAGATLAKLDIEFINGQLLVRYHDNGMGIRPLGGEEELPTGMGILNIEMRVRSINGEYTMEAEPGKGFLFEMKATVKQVYNPLGDEE